MLLRRVEPDVIDRCPVPGMARPPCRVGALGVLVDLVSMRQDRDVLPAMTLTGGDEADLAVAMFFVVPVDEARDPGAGVGEAGKRLIRVGRRVLQAADDRGWAVRPSGLHWIPRTPLYVYLLEPIREKTVMGVVNWEDLAEIEESTRALSWQETMDALTGMLAEDERAKARPTEDAETAMNFF